MAAKVRSGPASAWQGTRRTAGWVTGGIGRGWHGTTGAVGRATSSARAGVREGAESAWDRSGGAALMESARSNPRVAIAWASLTLLVIAWIAWTVYVSVTNGTNAGLGVLISWPAVLTALAIVSAPFIGAALLVRRRRGGPGGPTIAGGAELSESGGDTEMLTGGTYPG